MKANVIRMAKSSILKGLKKSKYNIATADPEKPDSDFFTSSEDRSAAVMVALRLMMRWKSLAQQDPTKFPSNLQEIERFLDIELANSSGVEAVTLFNSPFKTRSNDELVKEAHEAIQVLRSLGDSKKADTIKGILEIKLRKQ
jgi:hypothetical protein